MLPNIRKYTICLFSKQKHTMWYRFCIILLLKIRLSNRHMIYAVNNSCSVRHSIVRCKWPSQLLFAYNVIKYSTEFELPLTAFSRVFPFGHSAPREWFKTIAVVEFDRWYWHDLIIKTVSTIAIRRACHLQGTHQYHTIWFEHIQCIIECCIHVRIICL